MARVAEQPVTVPVNRTGTPSVRRGGVAAAAMVALAMWASWLSFPALGHGPSSYIRLHDTADSVAAFYIGQPQYASRDLIGLWTPSAGAGVDARANGKHGIPLLDVVFRATRGQWWVPGALLWAATFTAAASTVLLLWRHLAVPLPLAMLAAVWFSLMYDRTPGLSGFYLGYGAIVPALPLVILGLAWASRQTAARAAAGAVLIGGVLGLSSSVTLVVLSLPLVLAWLCVVEPGSRRRHLAVFAVCAVSFAIVAAPVFAAMAAHAPDGHRTLWPAVPYGFDNAEEVWRAQQAAALDLLAVNAPLFVIAVIGWMIGRFRSRALSVLIVASALIVFHVYVVAIARVVVGLIHEPFATFQFDRLAVFLPFLAAAAGVLGLYYILVFCRARGRRASVAGTVATAIACAAIALVIGQRSVRANEAREADRQRGSTYSAFFDKPALRDLARRSERGEVFRVATFADGNWGSGQHAGFAWVHGLETADGYLNLYPRRYHALWAAIVAPALDASDVLREYFEHWGNRIYLFNPFSDGTHAQPAGDAFNLDLLSLLNVRFIASAMPLTDPRLTLLPTPAAETTGPGTIGGLRVYENETALPRFFVTSRSREFETPEAVLAALSDAGVAQLRDTVFVERGDGTAPRASRESHEPVSVRVARYTADRIELHVDAPTGGTLVVTNNYSPHWHATVGGQPVDIIRADYAFQGIPIQPGAHDVVLTYAPRYAFSPFAQTVGIGAVLVAGAWILSAHGNRRAGRPSSASRRLRLVTVSTVAVTAIIVGVAARAAARSGSHADPWIAGQWPYREAMTVSHPKAMRGPIDVPLLVRRGTADTRFWEATTSPRAIRFADENGRVLPYEIEQFDRAGRRFAAWVRIPALTTAERTIYLYYGDADAPDGQAPQDLWRSTYAAVWHMSDDRDGAVLRDSTSAHHARLQPDMVGRWRIAGEIGGAVRFDGRQDRAVVPLSADLQLGHEGWAVEFWVNPAVQGNRNFGLFQYGTSPMLFHLRYANVLKLERARPEADWSFHAASLDFDRWTHVALVRTQTRLNVVVNGSMRASLPATGIEDDGPAEITLGAGFQGTLEGALDEVRVRRGALPPGWSRTMYLAQTEGLIARGRVESREDGGW